MSLSAVLQHQGQDGIRLPGTDVQVPETCMSRRLFQIDCPGCGLTRSTMAMVRGDFQTAFHYNPAGPLIFLMIAMQVPFRLIAIRRLRWGLATEWPGGMLLAVGTLLVLIVQWLVRLG